MEYRKLGCSGRVVSSLALGTMTFGSESDERTSHAQLDAFVDAGGSLIDTADVYSAGKSEEIIGRWLGKQPESVRGQIVLATKGRFAVGSAPNDVGLSRRHLRDALHASLRRLGTESVDLYQLHAFDPRTPLEETLQFLDDAVRAGKIGYVGLSNYTGWQIQKIVDLAEFRALARSRGVTMAQIALAWLLDRPMVSSVILGARTVEQLQENLGAAGLHLTRDEIARLDAASDPVPADYPYGGPGIEQRSRSLEGSHSG